MRLLLLFMLLPFVGATQLTYYIRSDSVKIMKQGGNNELILQNGSRAVKGVLVNVGNGLTRFIASRTSGDTLFIGLDTLIGIGAAGWKLTGNAGLDSSTNFLGTTDNVDLRVRVNNIQTARLTPLRSTVVLDSLYPASIYIGQYAGAGDTILSPSSNIAIGPYAMRNYPGASTGANVAIGHMALHDYVGGGSEANTAIGFRSLARATTGFRNVGLGLNSLHNLTTGLRNTGVGSFAGEWSSTGNDNTFVGESSSRLHTIGIYNTSVGNSSAFSGTGSVKSITVTGGGSGYTTATVTISAPDVTPFGFTPSIQATATATINAGAITDIVITEIGAGYTTATVSITGDGTGATATATMNGADGNASVGTASLYSNRIGDYNVGVGLQAGYGDGSNANDRRQIDSFNTYIGTYATARLANPQTVAINKSTAIGYSAIVEQSNSIVLGATGADQPNVGIGITAPAYRFDVVGRSRFSDTLRANGPILANNTTDVIPNLSSANLDLSEIKVGHRGSSDAGISIYRAQASNFGGGSINFYRTNSSDLSTKAAVISVQSIGQLVYYAVAGDNSTVSVSAIERVRANGNAKTTYAPAFYEISLRDTSGVLGTSFRTYPEGTKVGSALTTAAAASAQFEVESTIRGFLMPRHTAAQQAAVVSPTNGLMVVNTDSLGRPMVYYNGAWHGIKLTVDGDTYSGSTFTPTGTAGSNVDAVTPFAFHYTRVGSTVTFSGTVEIDATAAGGAIVELSLPFASAFTSTTDAAGTASTVNGAVYGSVANDRLVILITAAGGAPTQYQFTGSYQIK